ncbi:hypothetical protein ACGFWE_43180 [Streptomyces sp. NPDC048523]|uniref:hypothetical protein n=1 Tax=Streptomyces sp. NPDC048523 TaxID=3365567 RepID=UPI003722173E
MTAMYIASREEPDRPGPGRRLKALTDAVTSEHREWLVPLRVAFLESGLTYKQLCPRALTSPTQLSRLLNGTDGYPDLERMLNLRDALQGAQAALEPVERLKSIPSQHGITLHSIDQDEPPKPVQHLQDSEWFRKAWEAGAVAIGRPAQWIRARIQEVDRKEAAARRGALARKVIDGFGTTCGVFVGAMIIAWLILVLSGAHWGEEGNAAGSAPAPHTCRVLPTGATCQVSDRESQPSWLAEPRTYVRYAPPTNRAGTTRWTVRVDTPVYTPNGEDTGLYVRAGETVYVKTCKDSASAMSRLVIANSDGMSIAKSAATPEVAGQSCDPDSTASPSLG